ncbi:hypothetical protein PACTADRAFT_49941 [Pachysolen tannophilus NRRL Y-2460]|uniref:non-specific serine/threonine protein kinase n=1 Tax=Pachysolen tannophilus NRRL Y-2460 TaxID=669874 RepID=A0A1E4TTX0_PACTA|nr:hypothetical protein PACTADRAFT_49941 [Pachysolen tannophilus NRRL Y-2460]
MQILGNAASEFKGRQLTELVDNNSIAISWEVLKIYSPESNNHAKIKNALLYIASTLLPNETNPLEVYLERTILGIVQNFSESTYDVKGLQPFIEKLRAIWAIDCLIAISGKSIVSALPQIMACIQTNLELSHLHYESLRCLKILIKNLSQSNLSIILDLILSLILQKWSQFSEKTKLESKEILNILFKEHEALIKKKYFNYIFSLSFNPELLGIYNNARVTFPNSIKGTSFSLLHDLTLRSKNENKFVVAQALSDLEYYFKKYQNEFHSSYVNNPSFINYIPVLRSTLLEVSHKFRSSDVEIPTKCAIVFGLMGSLDFNKFNNFSVISSDEKDQLIILKQFTDRNEVYRFLIIFVKSVLVKAFWASTDPVKQLFLAYAMQEYMKLLELNGIDVESFSKDEINKTSTPAIIWSKFDDISKSTLLPLLSSKYIVNGSKNENLTYPIYKTWMKHSKWLRDFTLDLLRKSKHEGINPAAQKIFLICTSIIKDQDLSICNFILPYATLNLILCKDEKIEKEIETEMLAILGSNVSGVNDNSTAEHLKSCYQSVFGILDYFKKWCSARKQKKKRADLSSISTKTFNEETSLVENFLNRMPQELIAKRSAECNSYERAILNLEESYRSSKIERNEFFSTIQSMYVEIDDLDALDGVLKKFSTQSLTDKLLQFQYSDNWKIAQDCFEALSESDLNREKVKDTTDLLKSLNDYSLYDSSLEKLDAQLSLLNGNLNMLASEWVRIGLNSSVYAGNLHALKKWIYVTESNIKPSSLTDSALFIDYEFAKALVFLAEDKIEDTVSHINKAFQLLGYSLAMSKETSLSRTRSIINQLHCLTDLKEIALSTSKSKSESNIKTLDLRYSNVSNDFQSCWRILSTRRAADNLHPNDFTKNDISNIWIESAKIARKSERLDLATKSIMNAMLLENQKVDLEYAKLLWAQGDHSRALKAIDELRSSDNERSIRENALIQLKYTKWLDSSDSGNSSTIIDEYNKAAKMDVKWEKPYYLLGKYFNKILENQSIVSEDIKSSKDFYGDYERRLVFNYLRALQCGSKYLFEALPKVITVWLDFASKYKDKVPRKKKNYDLIKESIKQSINLIPAICWYTVLSQLISRALHPNPEAAEQVMDLVSKITEAYPEQALWSVFAQSKSTITERSKMGNNILSNIIQRPSNPEESVKRKNTIKSAINLFDALLGVCMKEVNKKRSDLILSTDFGFDHKVTPCVSLVVPLRSNFEIKLPASFDLSSKNYKSFPIGSKITIIKFDEHVKILSSMQKPRRLAILGSNGGKYHILCKPHDDLRKDAKLMEFTTMIDRLLKKDDESEKRKLSITSYAVVPLNETYGVLEWVDSCRTMRDIVLSYLTSIGKPLDFSFCKKMLAEDQSLQEKITGLNRLIKEYPPVFRLWFLEEFPDPKAWYGARCNYTRSSAVMSIIGYILGMGDRHGDNILMLEKTGGVLHVDFDCLFDKGLTLAVPERVPFRLTSNMVDAFGISGVEGAFRKSCEVTMRLVRNHEPALMNILESFLYDPILDWSATKRRKKHDSHNPEVSLNNIKKKIRGIEKDASLSLSIPAHVDAVISQAVSPENLAQMYIGWMSFI